MRETTTVRGTARGGTVRPAGWWWDGLLLVALVGLTVALVRGHLLDADLAVADWAEAHRPTLARWTAMGLNLLGQGTPLTLIALGLAVLLGFRARSVRPVLPVVLAFLLTGLTIGPLKFWTDRAAPSAIVKWPFLPPDDAVRLFNGDLPANAYAESYPSGHVANAIVWYGVIALLVAALLRTLDRPAPGRALRVLRIAPPVVVFCTTTYLGWHWLSDSVAGLLLGLLLDRLLARCPWDTLPLPSRAPGVEGPPIFTSIP